jgi:hypothetical protein
MGWANNVAHSTEGEQCRIGPGQSQMRDLRNHSNETLYSTKNEEKS